MSLGHTKWNDRVDGQVPRAVWHRWTAFRCLGDLGAIAMVSVLVRADLRNHNEVCAVAQVNSIREVFFKKGLWHAEIAKVARFDMETVKKGGCRW